MNLDARNKQRVWKQTENYNFLIETTCSRNNIILNGYSNKATMI